MPVLKLQLEVSMDIHIYWFPPYFLINYDIKEHWFDNNIDVIHNNLLW